MTSLAGNDRTIHALNVVRGLAALLVVFSHARSYLFQALGSDMTGFQKILFFPTGFAEEAVAVFFVLSGYLVGGQVIRQVREGRFSWRAYLVKRLSRMWVVLVPALALTLVLDIVSRNLFPQQFDLIRSPGELDPITAGCNLAFLQSTRCHAYGSNDALWSLSFEFWFYILFAGATVAAFSLLRKSWKSFAIGAVAAIGAIAVFGLPLFRLIFAWLVGVAVAMVHARWKEYGTPAWVRSRVGIWTVIGIAGVGVAASAFVLKNYEMRFAVVGLAVAPLILFLAAGSSHSPRWVRSLGRTGDWSFSTYAYHLPILKLLIVFLAPAAKFDPMLAVIFVYMIGAAAAVLCVPLWALTEKRTALVRDLIMRKLAPEQRSLSRSAAP